MVREGVYSCRLHYFVSCFIAIFCQSISVSLETVLLPEIDRTAISGKNITLACPLESHPDTFRVVKWLDLVYNSNPEPIEIYSSARKQTAMAHPNQGNIQIEEDYSLTVSSLRFDDAGQYICRRWTNASVVTDQYYTVTVGEMPRCSMSAGYIIRDVKYSPSTVLLRENVAEHSNITLECSATFSGNNHPVLHWSYTDKDSNESHQLPADDGSEVRLVRLTTRLIVTPSDDSRRYTCHMKFGNVHYSCSLMLNVTYAVSKVAFHPMSATYAIGEQVTCIADGNPAPSITLLPGGLKGIRGGPGWRSFTVVKEWLGKNKTVQCSASSTVEGGFAQEVTASITFDITRVAMTTAATSDTSQPTAAMANTGAVIAGIAIGSLVIVLIIVAILCLRKRNDDKSMNAPKPVPTSEEEAAKQESKV